MAHGWLAVVMTLVVLVPPAAAERARRVAVTTPSAELTWRAPAGCPDAASVRARIERRLERPLEGSAQGIEVDVTRVRDRFVAQVDLRARTVANDVRTLTSQRCSELADGVAVIVARVIGETLARPIAEPPVATVDVAAVEPGVLDEERPSVVSSMRAPSSPLSPPRPWTLGARVSGISGIGVIPKVGLGGELAVTLRYDRRLVELAGARWVESASQFYRGAPARVDVDLDVAIARYGWRPPELPLRAWLGVEVGTMRGRGVQLPTQPDDQGRWIAAGAGFGVAWQMTPWIRLLGTTEALLAVERVRFTRDDGMVTYAPAPLSARFSCGLEIGWQ